MICDHCGSDSHTYEDCTVREATRRILGPIEPIPVGRLTINGGYVGRVDGHGNLQGGSLFADSDGTVHWVPDGHLTRDRSSLHLASEFAILLV